MLKDTSGARENRNGNTDRNLNGVSVQAVIENRIVTQNVGDRDVADLCSHNDQAGSVLTLP
jgi:hypothetical protein